MQNKVVVVTGSTTGIGRAIARRIVAEGGKVIIHGRREDAAQALCEELGEAAHYVLADLAHSEECPKIIEAATEHFGRLDGLVNNAAITTRSDIDSTDASLFQRMMAVNVHAPLLLAKASVGVFRRQDVSKGECARGTILNIGSINAYCGQTDLLLYSMTKGALMTFTRNLADALGTDQIRVNQLNVGWTATENEIELKKKEGLAEDWHTNVPDDLAPFGRLLMPEDIASHAVFWMSEDSAPASGVVTEVEQFPVIGRQQSRQADELSAD